MFATCLQLDMLKPGMVGTYDDYGQRYCIDPRFAGQQQGGGGLYSTPYRGITFIPSCLAKRMSLERVACLCGLSLCVGCAQGLLVPCTGMHQCDICTWVSAYMQAQPISTSCMPSCTALSWCAALRPRCCSSCPARRGGHGEMEEDEGRRARAGRVW